MKKPLPKYNFQFKSVEERNLMMDDCIQVIEICNDAIMSNKKDLQRDKDSIKALKQILKIIKSDSQLSCYGLSADVYEAIKFYEVSMKGEEENIEEEKIEIAKYRKKLSSAIKAKIVK